MLRPENASQRCPTGALLSTLRFTDCETDDLVRQYAPFLKHHGLFTGPWEALNDPALTFSLEALYFFIDQVTNDFVVN